MTVASTTANTSATGNGSATSFPYNFSAGSAGEVEVFVNGSQVLVGYTVVPNADHNGGTVTFTTAPANGATILIATNPLFTQPIRFENAGAYNPALVDQVADEDARRDIYLKDSISRTLRVPQGETVSLIPSLASRQNMLASYDAFGNPTVVNPTGLTGTKGDPGGSASSIGLFVNAGGISIPIGTDAVRTSGYSTLGIGIADYVFDATINSSYVSANPHTSFITTNGRGYRLAHNGTINITQVGGLPDGTTDNYAQIVAAMSALGANGGVIFFPKGVYRVSHLVMVTTRILFLGTGVGEIGGPVGGVTFTFPNTLDGSMLWLDAGVGGLQFVAEKTDRSGSAIYAGAGDSAIEKLAIASASEGTAFTGIYGVESRTKITMRDVLVRGFGDHGIYIQASLSGGDGVVYGNANKCVLDNVRSVNNKGDGCRTSGNDCNNTNFTSCHWQGNGGWGRFDDSFLPNQELGGIYEGNVAGRVKSTRQIGHSLLGCHAEEDGGTIDLDSTCMVDGGLLGQSPLLDPSRTPFVRYGGVATVQGYRHNNAFGTTTIGSQVGVTGTGMAAFAWGNSDALGFQDFTWEFDGTSRWRMVYGHSIITMQVPDGNHSNGRNNAMEFPRGIAVGQGASSAPNLIQYGGGIPTSGTFVLGDIIFSVGPTAGGKIGWVCVTGGTPGTWKAFGAIDA